MPDRHALPPVCWPIAELRKAYARGAVSPLEVVEDALARLQRANPRLNAIVTTLDDLARQQAAAAQEAYRAGAAGPLAGIAICIKDTFDVADAVCTRGSLVYRERMALSDSGAVRRLRNAGAVFLGKGNTAEFGQSATTENRLGDACRNPWDVSRTPGGSSGGAAACVAAGIVMAGLGADGGGSIRIPAAFTGLVGIKPTFGACPDEGGFEAMSDFCCSGPLCRTVADCRTLLEVLMERSFARRHTKRPLRVAWCPRPENRPVDAELAAAVAAAVGQMSALGHDVEEVDLPLARWNKAFAPLVLEEEGRLRGHLLDHHRDELSQYELVSLEAALRLDADDIAAARAEHKAFQAKLDSFFEDYDVILTPATSVPAFPIAERPREITGEPVDALWGAFPFTAPFNVSGSPAASIPCGLADGMPVGIQLVCGRGQDALLLDIAEDLEETLDFALTAVMDRFVDADQREVV